MKIKAISALLAVMLILLPVLSSCNKNPDPTSDKGTLAANDIVDYFFYYPEKWQMNTSTGMLSVFAEKDLSVQTGITSPEGNEVIGVYLRPQFSVTAFNLSGNDYPTIESYWNVCKTQYEANFSNVELLSQDTEQIGGYDALNYTFTADITGVTYKYSQTIFFAKAMIYTITYTSTPEVFDEFLDDVKSMKSSFEFK